jgi:hypothetical protein
MLPPELCFIPNLPEDFTRNAMAMRDIQELKTVNPGKRFDRIMNMGNRLRQNPDMVQANVGIADNLTQVKARYLHDLKMKDPKKPTIETFMARLYLGQIPSHRAYGT